MHQIYSHKYHDCEFQTNVSVFSADVDVFVMKMTSLARWSRTPCPARYAIG